MTKRWLCSICLVLFSVFCPALVNPAHADSFSSWLYMGGIGVEDSGWIGGSGVSSISHSDAGLYNGDPLVSISFSGNANSSAALGSTGVSLLYTASNQATRNGAGGFGYADTQFTDTFTIGINTIEPQHVEMNVKIQGVAKALHEGHGAAPDRPIGGAKACPAAQRTEYGLYENVQNIPDKVRIVSGCGLID